MGVFASPALPLAAALATACAWPGRWYLWLSLVLLALRWAWLWWCNLLVAIDGVIYKERYFCATVRAPASASTALGASPIRRKTHAEKLVSKEGFCTPRETSEAACSSSGCSDALAVEWAPFSPSLPYGDPGERDAGNVSPSLPPKPYWLECDASVFDVRNICYKQTKEKVASGQAIYDCVGMDLIRDRRRIDGLVERLPSAAACGALPASPPGAASWSASWGIPRVLVVNCQLPYKAGYLMGAHPEDDGGLSVCNYFVLSAWASNLLAQDQATPSLRLWKRLVEEGVSTKDGIAFKVVGRVEDLEKYEVPESFHRFNNKPVLLTKSSRIITSRLPEVVEIDYDVRGWVFPARSALANYHMRAGEAELEIGYVVEGKTDDELPEQILGCCILNHMDITQARWVSVM